MNQSFIARHVDSLLVALGLITLALIIAGSYVFHGGFLYDNWAFAAEAKFHGFSGLLSEQISWDPRRPLSAIYFATTSAIFGTHQHYYIALAVILHVALALALYALLRRFAFDRLSAGLAGALCLLFPSSDTTWLWSSQGEAALPTLLWLLGLLAGLAGLQAERRRWVLHGVGIACYIASIFLYELTLPVVALSGGLYLLRAPVRQALRWWAVELVAIGLAVLLVTSRAVHLLHGEDIHQVQGVSGALHQIHLVADQGLTLVAKSLLPFGTPARFAVVVAALAIAGVAATVAKYTSDDELRADLRRWLATAAIAALFTAAGWVILAAAGDYYVPLQVGIGNRINIAAGIGIVVLAVALIGLIASLAFQTLGPRRRLASSLLTAFLGVAVGGAYLSQVAADRGAYERAHTQSMAVLAALGSEIRKPRSGSTVIATGFNLWAAPGVPVFAATWDLQGAARLLWNDDSLQAWPAPPGGLQCTGRGASVAGVTPPGVTAPYGRLLYVDVSSGVQTQIKTAAQCRVAAST